MWMWRALRARQKLIGSWQRARSLAPKASRGGKGEIFRLIFAFPSPYGREIYNRIQ